MGKENKEIGTGFAIFIVGLIIFFVAVFAYWIWQRYVTAEMF